MPNAIFNALMEEKIELFKNTFVNTAKQVFYDSGKKKLIHPGEFGIYRERIVKNFIKLFIPQNVDINSGFIITPKNNVSTQCDIVLYHKNVTPMIESEELQKFFPVETVVGVGEVKSIISKTDLKEALNKLAAVKCLRKDVEDPNIVRKFMGNKKIYNPAIDPCDNIFTFLICQKFCFDIGNKTNEIDHEIYESELNHCYRHNLILSVEDGLLLYNLPQDAEGLPFYYPTFALKGSLSARFIKIKIDKPFHHFKTFANFLFNGIIEATVLFPDMVYYMEGFNPVKSIR